MLRRLVVTIAAMALVAVAAVSAASGDPGNAKGALRINATCGARAVTVIVNGNGVFAPAHVVGSTSMFIPTAFNLTFTFTPTTGSPTVEHETSAKAAAIKNTVTCTIPSQTLFSGPEGTGVLQGTVTGFFTPRG